MIRIDASRTSNLAHFLMGAEHGAEKLENTARHILPIRVAAENLKMANAHDLAHKCLRNADPLA